MRFWIGWNEPGDDPRPTAWPLPPLIHYWISGEGDGYHTLCAVVDAASEAAAKDLIDSLWYPTDWRFCQEKADTWRPGERFPWPDSTVKDKDREQ